LRRTGALKVTSTCAKDVRRVKGNLYKSVSADIYIFTCSPGLTHAARSFQPGSNLNRDAENWIVFMQISKRLAKIDSAQEFFLLLALRQFTYYK
jgi:hypothetical protein